MRITERDLAVFGWLTDMKAIYEEDLAALIACMPPAPGASPGSRPSAVRVRALLRRWQLGGFADARKLIAGRPRIVRLLRSGAELAGAEAFRETSPITAYHQCEVSRLRLYLESRPSPSLGELTHWESERAFRSDLAALGLARHREQREVERVHIPDGVATYEGEVRVAIEVERSVKAPARLARIVERLLAEYPVTLYAVDGRQVRTAVVAAERTAQASLARRGISPDRVGVLSVIDLPEQVT